MTSGTSGRAIDESFTALPYRRMAEAALTRARDFHVSHADFRFERIRSQDIRVRDGRLQGANDSEDVGFAVRVILDGAWGFACGVVLGTQSAVGVAETAVRTAQVAAAMTSRPIELAPEPTYDDVEWVSAYEIDPLAVPLAEKVEHLSGWSARLLESEAVDHSNVTLHQVVENKFYADLAGTTTTQQRVRVEPVVEVHGTDEKTGVFDSMRTIAPPVGRGWEYLTDGYDWDTAIGELPDLLAEKLTAPSVEPGPLRPGHPPLEPVADHPRVHRSRHRARPRARLRGQLRRHVVRDARPAQHSCSTDRRSCTSPATGPSSTAWPPSGTTTRVSRPRSGTSSRTASSSATSWTARWPR